VDADADAVPKVVVPGASSQQRDRHHPLMKRKRSMAEVFEAETQVETQQSPRPPPLKRKKHSSNGVYGSYYHLPPYCPVPPRRSTALEAKGGRGQEQAVSRRPPTPRPAPKLVPYCGLWERLGGRNTPSFYSDDHDEDRGRPPRRRL